MEEQVKRLIDLETAICKDLEENGDAATFQETTVCIATFDLGHHFEVFILASDGTQHTLIMSWTDWLKIRPQFIPEPLAE